MRLDTAEWETARDDMPEHKQAIMIDGNAGESVSFPACCHAIPGDNILGYLGKGEGLQIHTHECRQAQRLHHRDLHYPLRRQRQMCIRDRCNSW